MQSEAFAGWKQKSKKSLNPRFLFEMRTWQSMCVACPPLRNIAFPIRLQTLVPEFPSLMGGGSHPKRETAAQLLREIVATPPKSAEKHLIVMCRRVPIRSQAFQPLRYTSE